MVRNGDLFKEQLEAFRARFKTLEGGLTWVLATGIWYGFLVRFLVPLNDLILEYLLGQNLFSWLAKWTTWLILSLIFTPGSLALTYLLTRGYRLLRKYYKRFKNG